MPKLTVEYEIEPNGNCSNCECNNQNVCVAFNVYLKGFSKKMEIGSKWINIKCKTCKDFLEYKYQQTNYNANLKSENAK